MAENQKVLALRPGYLVALSTSITGGVEYAKQALNAKEEAEAAAVKVVDGSTVEAWKTVKLTEDAKEYDRAVKVRGAARSMVSAVCVQTPFSLLCPADKLDKLEQARRDAYAARDESSAFFAAPMNWR